MGVRSFRELVAWQLSADLREEVIAALANPQLRKHVQLCDQLARAVESAPGLIAEGYGRFYAGEFVRYLRMARAELMEAQNHLDAALRRRAIDVPTFERCWTLSQRAVGATTRLLIATHRRTEGDHGR